MDMAASTKKAIRSGFVMDANLSTKFRDRCGCPMEGSTRLWTASEVPVAQVAIEEAPAQVD